MPLSREQKIEKARELRAKGLTYQKIADRLEVTRGAVWKWLHPEKVREWDRRENAKPGRKIAKRAHADACRRGCADCGDLLSAGSDYPSAPERYCTTCHRTREAERVGERARQIEAWWAEGLSLREIEDRLDWSKGHLAMVYNGSFPLEFLTDDEHVAAAGDGSGRCVITSPTGATRLKPGDWVSRRSDGTLFSSSPKPPQGTRGPVVPSPAAGSRGPVSRTRTRRSASAEGRVA
jgi:transcriptional regulator with XRE-family HTH domain